MANRKVILFKLNGQIVAEQTTDKYISEIEEFKRILASELECHSDEIEVSSIFVNNGKELSSIDVTPDGMIIWDESQNRLVVGISCCIKIGSDKFLDAISNKNIEDYMTFILEEKIEDDMC